MEKELIYDCDTGTPIGYFRENGEAVLFNEFGRSEFEEEVV